MLHAIPNKAGKLVEARFPDLTIKRRPRDGAIEVHAPGNHRIFEQTDEGFRLDHLDHRGNRRFTPERISTLARAFYKIGLELLYHDGGPELAMSPRFDELRRIVLGEIAGHGYLVISKKVELKLGGEPPPVGVRYQALTALADGQSAYYFEADLFGTLVTFDLERSELLPGMREEAQRRGWSILEF